jgi:hypothetical protein
MPCFDISKRRAHAQVFRANGFRQSDQYRESRPQDQHVGDPSVRVQAVEPLGQILAEANPIGMGEAAAREPNEVHK